MNADCLKIINKANKLYVTKEIIIKSFLMYDGHFNLSIFTKKIYLNSTEVKEKSWQKLPLILSASAP